VLDSSVMKGSFWIAISALLLSTDALVRFPATGESSSLWVVWIEHILVVVALLPLLKGHFPVIQRMWNRRDLALLLTVGAGGSALALWMFTESFQRTNPSIAILLQKVQPLIVISLAMFFLGERPSRRFYWLAPVVMVSAAALSWPEGQLSGPESWRSWEGALLSLGSAIIWAISTVAGRRLLIEYPTRVVIFMRYLFGTIALSLFVALEGGDNALNFSHLIEWRYLWPLLYLTFITGLLAMYTYYVGMASTPASLVTLVELLYPFGAVFLNAVFLDFHLSGPQWIAAIVLIGSTTWISIDREARVSTAER
jgi:drug/metabolite transporter (DMT)-like permease